MITRPFYSTIFTPRRCCAGILSRYTSQEKMAFTFSYIGVHNWLRMLLILTHFKNRGHLYLLRLVSILGWWSFLFWLVSRNEGCYVLLYWFLYLADQAVSIVTFKGNKDFTYSYFGAHTWLMGVFLLTFFKERRLYRFDTLLSILGWWGCLSWHISSKEICHVFLHWCPDLSHEAV